MRSRRVLSGLLAFATAAAVAAVPSALAGPVVDVPGGGAVTTVTLLTGDVVTVSGHQVVNIRPAPGRERLLFDSYTDERGDLTVVPEDAQLPLAQGVLDPRLFNVTDLVEAGYDDSSADRLPLIVEDAGGPALRSAAAEVRRELPAVGATAVSVARSGAFWPVARTAKKVWLDGRVRASLERSVPQIGAPAAWQAGHTGEGTKVAVLDTGIDTTHPDLAGAVVDAVDFTGGGNPEDRNGHGTHVASIITGEHARYRGVAPDTELLNGKVLSDEGRGYESDVLDGMQWAAKQGADVINMSLSGGLSDGTDPLSQAVNRLTAETGTLFVIATGNMGAVELPGTADAALTVGAIDRDGTVANFSGRGPRYGSGTVKPDITAPGVGIVAARAKDSVWGKPGDTHTALDGTSMATPHVAGAAAILAGQHTDWTAEQLKTALMGSATPKDGQSVFAQGTGRVDLAKAITATTTVSPASLDFGFVRWPHQGSVAKTLTYTNHGTAPVTYTLGVEAKYEDGSPAPQGMFTFSPSTVTVPAGGQAAVTVTVTGNVGIGGPAGIIGGTVTATAGDTVVRTSFGVEREVESYDVHVSAIAHDGTPSTYFNYRFVPVNWLGVIKKTVTEPTTVRLPVGEYTYTGFVRDREKGLSTTVVEPTFTVSGDTSLVFDAREGVPVEITTDDPSARDVFTRFVFERKVNTQYGITIATEFVPTGEQSRITVRPSASSHPDFTFTAEAKLAKWNGESFDGSPYLYHLKHSDHAIPRTPRWHDKTADQAKVLSDHAITTPGAFGVRDNVTFPLPGVLTEYYTPDVPWNLTWFAEDTDARTVSWLTQLTPLVFPRGKTTTTRWNRGVFGPAMAGSSGVAFRGLDNLIVQISPFADQDPGRGSDLRIPGTTQLLHEGEVIGESDMVAYGQFSVLPEKARYTLRTRGDRSGYAGLTTRYEGEWTFTSQRGDDPEWAVELPLLGVRFNPELDQHNAAPAGKPFRIPVVVQRYGSDTPGPVSAPTVEVSYDDGTTWKPALVHRNGPQWTALVAHPKDAKFVSLRSSVRDAEGYAQSQTIIRAYALK